MATLREKARGLWRESDHPQLAIEHLAPFRTKTEIAQLPDTEKKRAQGQKQQHQADVLARPWGTVLKDYQVALKRRLDALTGFKGPFEAGVTRFYRVEFNDRLAMGLGNASVMENGLALNHVYGLPMLAGSGLKGLASAMAHLGLEDESWRMGTPGEDYTDQGKDHRALFGDRDTGQEWAAAGMVIFHDGWWEPTPNQSGLPFELDVVTPHNGAYALSGESWPNDWTDPVPSPFLTVKGTFVVPLTGPREWVDAASDILKVALERLGFGAKTQIGYGRGTLNVHPRTEAEDVQNTQQERSGKLWLLSFSDKTFELDVEGNDKPIRIKAQQAGNDLEKWFGERWRDLLPKAKKRSDKKPVELVVTGGESDGRFLPTQVRLRP